jgi:hypothetical protein
MAIAVWRVRMKAKSESETWRWRRPTSWGLVILSIPAAIEGMILYCLFFPPFGSDDNGILNFASLVMGSLLVICIMILLTEKIEDQDQPPGKDHREER